MLNANIYFLDPLNLKIKCPHLAKWTTMDNKYEMKQGRKENSKRGANTDTNRQNRERGWDNVKFMIWKAYT